MALKRNYLTSSDLLFIYNELQQYKNPIEREIAKVAMVGQIVTDFDFSDCNNCNEIYDKLYALEFNIYDIKNEHLLNREESIDIKDTFGNIGNEVENAINGLKDNQDLKQAITLLTEEAIKHSK